MEPHHQTYTALDKEGRFLEDQDGQREEDNYERTQYRLNLQLSIHKE